MEEIEKQRIGKLLHIPCMQKVPLHYRYTILGSVSSSAIYDLFIQKIDQIILSWICHVTGIVVHLLNFSQWTFCVDELDRYTSGVATQFPALQFYSNPIVNF